MNSNQKKLLFVAGAVVVAGVAVSSRGGIVSKPVEVVKPVVPVKPITQSTFTICLDPGHGTGASNVGATNACTGVLERDEVLRAAVILEKFLLARGFKVFLTRRTVDAPGLPGYDLNTRVSMAENAKADLLLSLHFDMWQAHKVTGKPVCSGGNPGRGAGILYNAKAGLAVASGLAKALDVVTPGGVYTELRDSKTLYLTRFSKPMLLVEIDRVQRLSETDLTSRMNAISSFLWNWYLSE
jgi:N-acetylmuramoyl-L-alanine amidase